MIKIMFYRQKMKKSVKAKDSYGPVLARVKTNNIMKIQNENENTDPPPPGGIYKYTCISYIIIIFIYVIDLITMVLFTDESFGGNNNVAVISYNPIQNNNMVVTTQTNSGGNSINMSLIIPQKKTPSMAKPKWHAPWKLYRVISGHLGWVRCCAVEPGNEWFATGSADRVIKVRLLFRSIFVLNCIIYCNVILYSFIN